MLLALRNGSLVPAASVGSVNRLSTLFDRLFNDDVFAPLTNAPAWTALPLSLWEDEQNVYVEMDTPGVTEKDLDLSFHQGDLIIRGERKCQRQQDGCDTRSYGRFEQRVSLPTPVDSDRVEAKLASGVLWVSLPKSPEAKPRKIAIKEE